ncbi:head GIN domain-containing protein [Aureibacter tunicatorum]|uniref:Putative auto-transporter adhesin head GIN domain-containing protein n=1 Tax=Aureibacter tunicatorum TaxID=866807 RepID=A0AAE3XN02_9BACT|nr:head GIN domain-containing protein [Aureibacter tunicatorum]MDR6238860.1 hypothetical protein [Aureibacter tunicatorum]BDD05213.1 lipoprotein [Aureibacter tunicatorum]
MFKTLKNSIFLIIVFCFIGLTAFANKKVKGSGNVISETREISSFSGVKASGMFEIFYTQNDDVSLEVKSDDNLLQYIKTEVKNGTLIIKFEKDISLKKSTKMDIYISSPEMNSITQEGICKFTCQNNLKADELKVVNEGMGKIKLVGDAQSLIINNEGMGNIEASELKSMNVNIKNEGMGKIVVNATNELNVNNEGMGKVRYISEPSQISVQNEGMGSVRKK